MPIFSTKSLARLNTCHEDLVRLFSAIVAVVDCSIICGHRGREDQDAAFASDKSDLKYPDSKHNKHPSLAVDVAPYPIDWDDIPRFNDFAKYVRGIAASMDIVIRWGGDWDSDFQLDDQVFNDLVHFELMEE